MNPRKPHAFSTDVPPAGDAGQVAVCWRMRVKEALTTNVVASAWGGIYKCVLWDGTTEGAVEYIVAAAWPSHRGAAEPGGAYITSRELFAIAPQGGTGRFYENKAVALLALPFMPMAKARGEYLYLTTDDGFGTVGWSPGPRFCTYPFQPPDDLGDAEMGP